MVPRWTHHAARAEVSGAYDASPPAPLQLTRRPLHGADMSGTLYLVPTPLGDIADLSPRARQVLATVDLIAAEDTRETRNLLRRLELKASLTSCHDHNERRRVPGLIARIESGQSIALVSDAGTPLLDDPGLLLVQAALAAGLRVVPLPGPSAALTALIASGIPLQRYCHLGFLPRAAGRRRAAILEFIDHPGPLVIYEAPHRMIRCLETALEVLGDRRAALSRNLTRHSEEHIRGRLSEIKAQLEEREEVRGQLTLVVAPAESDAPEGRLNKARAAAAALAPFGVPRKVLARTLAECLELPRRMVYQALLEE